MFPTLQVVSTSRTHSRVRVRPETGLVTLSMVAFGSATSAAPTAFAKVQDVFLLVATVSEHVLELAGKLGGAEGRADALTLTDEEPGDADGGTGFDAPALGVPRVVDAGAARRSPMPNSALVTLTSAIRATTTRPPMTQGNHARRGSSS